MNVSYEKQLREAIQFHEEQAAKLREIYNAEVIEKKKTAFYIIRGDELLAIFKSGADPINIKTKAYTVFTKDSEAYEVIEEIYNGQSNTD